MRAIIVDDEPFSRELFFMEAEGVDGLDVVGAFADGSAALEFVSESRECGDEVDLVFMDIVMPYMDGVELMREIKRICPGAAIVVASACNQYDDGLHVGGDCNICKPFRREDIERCAKKAEGWRRMRG